MCVCRSSHSVLVLNIMMLQDDDKVLTPFLAELAHEFALYGGSDARGAGSKILLEPLCLGADQVPTWCYAYHSLCTQMSVVLERRSQRIAGLDTECMISLWHDYQSRSQLIFNLLVAESRGEPGTFEHLAFVLTAKRLPPEAKV